MIFRALYAIPAALLLAAPALGQTITKCQDAEGNWHYGDFAAEACDQDKSITELNERGVKVKEQEAPPTQEELEQQKAAKLEEQRKAEQRAKEAQADERLLRTYESEQEIVDARDARVKAMDREMESYRLFRQDLVDEKQAISNGNGDHEDRISSIDKQIQQYDEAIGSIKREKQDVINEYNQDLERYRELAGE